MTLPWLLSAGALAAITLLLALWWRERAEAARLRQRLEDGAGHLEHLQRTFSSFVPLPPANLRGIEKPGVVYAIAR